MLLRHQKCRTLVSRLTRFARLTSYLGTALADLTFIEDGNPDYVDGLINFTKRQLLSGVIMKMQTYQQQKYNLHVVDPLRSYLLSYPLLPLEQCYILSLAREPRKTATTTPRNSRRMSKMLS